MGSIVYRLKASCCCCCCYQWLHWLSSLVCLVWATNITCNIGVRFSLHRKASAFITNNTVCCMSCNAQKLDLKKNQLSLTFRLLNKQFGYFYQQKCTRKCMLTESNNVDRRPSVVKWLTAQITLNHWTGHKHKYAHISFAVCTSARVNVLCMCSIQCFDECVQSTTRNVNAPPRKIWNEIFAWFW